MGYASNYILSLIGFRLDAGAVALQTDVVDGWLSGRLVLVVGFVRGGSGLSFGWFGRRAVLLVQVVAVFDE